MPAKNDPSSDREIVLTRVFDAPRELVFKVWTDPEHIPAWWGPTGFRTTTHSMDVRPGGVWRFVMHGPDGTDYHNNITYLEVVPPARLVYTHRGDDAEPKPVRFHVVVTFEDQAGQTKLTLRMTFDTAAERNHVVEKYGAIEGARQMLQRLSEHLAVMK